MISDAFAAYALTRTGFVGTTAAFDVRFFIWANFDSHYSAFLG